MADRDNFSKKVRQAVAARAAYFCSFDGCAQLTVGPSDESEMAVAHTGVAAHIHAAAPGGKRYLASMTTQERTHIDNAIWMCGTHGTLIDQDDVTYTADRLRAMKESHEGRIAQLQRSGSPPIHGELMALGPNLVFIGEIVAMGVDRWTAQLDHFVIGDLSALVAFVDRFGSMPRWERYVLVNQLGDGRVLAEPPSWCKRDGGLVIDVRVESRFPRTRAQDLGATFALDPDGDVFPDFRMISGLDALPQKILLCLWHQKGPAAWNREYGTRVAEYYCLFQSSPWLAQLFKTEAIRLAAIPHAASASETESTLFQCVEQVRTVEMLAEVPTDEHLAIRLELDVCGVGLWSREVSLYVPKFPFEGPTDDAILQELLDKGRRP